MSTDKIENKDKAEQKVSKDELSDRDAEKVTGGSITRSTDKADPNFFKN